MENIDDLVEQKEIQNSAIGDSAIQPFTELDCIVLGSTGDNLVSHLAIADQLLKVTPRTYETVFRQADLRLFNLRKRIGELGRELAHDDEIDSILAGGIQQEFAQA